MITYYIKQSVQFPVVFRNLLLFILGKGSIIIGKFNFLGGMKMVIGVIAVLSAIFSALICWGTDANWIWALPAGFVGCFLGILVLGFLLILAMSKCVDLDKEQLADNPFYRAVLYIVADAAHTVLRVRVHTEGMEKLPSSKALLVCNHLDNVDPVIIMHQVKKKQRLAFIAKREVADMFVVGKFMHKLLCQRVNRENDREALKTILKCIEILKADKASIAVFPEGGIRGGNVLHPFRHGVFKIALRTKVPVVVCTLWGTQNIVHNGLRLKPTDVDFHVLGVIRPEEYQEMTAVELGKLAYGMMAEDMGPDRVLPLEETP